MWAIKFFLLLLQHLFLIIEFYNLLLFSLYQVHSSIRVIDNLKQLQTNALLHRCDKFSALNVFSYCSFAVESPWNINFHCVCNFLNFFYSCVINVSLHLMNRISRINCCDSCLIFCVFENETNYWIYVSNYNVCFVIKM